MIPDRVVEEVRARADIVEIIGEFVQLKKVGKDYRGLSPFKKENTPSFFVVPAKAFFNDFSSGESGDVFGFLMKHQGMSFVDAVKFVGARSGVDVREVKRRDAGDDPWRPYYDASAFARAFFRERLWEWDGGQNAREYLEARGISQDVAERFGIGYAPGDWESLRDAASVHGVEEGILLELGLVKKSENGERVYDAFRNRIMFPIESVSGRVLGFGGRIIGKTGKGAPKYINSPESPIFHKGATLYGLGWARNHIRKGKAALLVEGFMDVVSLAAVDIGNAVATLGTSLTREHAQLLRSYTTQVRILFDSDPAGLRATFRTADILLSEGIRATVVTLPDGEDPDSLARSGGADAVLGHVDQAVDVLDRKIAMLEARDRFASIEQTRDALDRLLPTLRAVQDPRLRDIYVTRVAERTGVRVDTLMAELREAPEVHESRPMSRARPTNGRPAPRFHGLGVERQLILLLLAKRGLVERVGERIGAADLEETACRAIFEELIYDPELKTLPEGTMPEAVLYFERLMRTGTKEVEESSEAILNDVILQIENRTIDRRLDALNAQIERATESEKVTLLRDKQDLIMEKRSRGTDWRRFARMTAGNRQRQGEGIP